MTNSRLELRVGIFVFVGLTALCIMIILFGFRYVGIMQDSYNLTAMFHFTNGIVVGAPVRFSGVDVGKVTAIEFSKEHPNTVNLLMNIQKGLIIRKDARLIINSLGVMGEKYLEFIPRSADAELLQEGDSIQGEEPLPLNDVVSESLLLIGQIRQTFTKVFDEKTIQDMKDIVHQVKDLTDEETEKMFKESLSNIARLTDDETSQSIKKSLKNIEMLTGEKTQAHLETLFYDFQSTSSAFRSVIEENRDEIREIAEKWKNISVHMENILKSLENAEGTMGLLISSPALHENLDRTLTNLSEWISMIRKHGLLYKEKDVRKDDSSAKGKGNRGYFR